MGVYNVRLIYQSKAKAPCLNQVMYNLFPPCPLGPLTASRCYPEGWSSTISCSSSLLCVTHLAQGIHNWHSGQRKCRNWNL